MNRRSFLPGRLVCLVVFWALSGCGEGTSPDRQKIEEPTPSAPSMQTSLERGMVLLSRLGCAHCHDGIDDRVLTKDAPRLDGVASRVDPHFLSRWIESPTTVHADTTMPDVLSHLPDDESRRDATAITHYLVSLSEKAFQRTHRDEAAVARGEVLFHEVGCVACHGPQDEDLPTLDDARRFPDLASKYSHAALSAFLENPLRTWPSGRMPDLHLSRREANDIAHYLMRERELPSPLRYEEHRGHRKHLGDIERSELYRTGGANGFHLDIPHRDRDCFLVFKGFLDVREAGIHEFYLEVDDRGRLVLDDEEILIVDKKGKPPHFVTAAVHLEPGLLPIRLEFFQWRKEELLSLEWMPPGGERGPIPANRLRATREELPEPEPWVLDPSQIERGKELFMSTGCRQCHAWEARTEERESVPISDLARGCLDPEDETTPRYSLGEDERSALQEALADLTRTEKWSTQRLVAHKLAVFDCFACHDRDGRGGVPEAVREFFTSEDPSIGEEGSIPPSLGGIGNKLQPQWLARAINGEAPVRPYVKTRMPTFGIENLGDLAAEFVELDHRPSELAPITLDPQVARDVGRELVDVRGLQCIMCHTFNRQPSIGIEALDLGTMTQQLNRDWFHRFLLDPTSLKPTTLMPEFWPKGESVMPEVLNGDATAQIDALWLYLSDGKRAIFPEGLSRKSLELIVGGEAVVYRGKLWEAGYRGIAVGFPEDVHLAFDAQDMRLSLLWKEKFLNVAAHWRIQGMGRIRPHGGDVLVFPQGPAFGMLESPDEAWPDLEARELGLKFGGYELDNQRRATFFYRFGDIDILDFPFAVEQEASVFIRRRFTFTSPSSDHPIFLRLFRGESVLDVGEGGYRCGDRLTVRLTEGEGIQAVSRTSEGEDELLVRVQPTEAGSVLTVDYVW